MADNLNLSFPSHDQGERVARALETMAANGASNAASLDAIMGALLDGTNTTRIFWAWLPQAQALNTDATKYQLLSRFADMLALAWKDKTYTVRKYNAEVSSDTAMTPLDDLAGKPAALLCTDADTTGADWHDEDPMFWYIRANALSLADGTMNVLAIEGEAAFDITGETAPVYAFSLALWRKVWDDGQYRFKSWRTAAGGGFRPYPGDVAPDNTKRALTWHPVFGGGLAAGGGLTSGAGKAPYINAGATTGLTKARITSAYEGLWNDCDTEWLLDEWQFRHYNTENSGIAEGCTSYNLEYTPALAETGVKRVLLTVGQAGNILLRSTLQISASSRGGAVTAFGQVARKETVTVEGTEYGAVYLDVAETFDTTTELHVATMPWYSGETEHLPGHADGCTVSLTAGKTPLRVAGVEVLDGAYALGLDPLYNVTANAESGFDYQVFQCRDSVNLAGSVTSNYENTGITYTGMASGWNYVKEFALNLLGIVFPSLLGGASNTYYKSAAFGTASAGVRCPWRFGNLNNGGNAGLAYENLNNSPGNANWNGRPRLSSLKDPADGSEASPYPWQCLKSGKTAADEGARPWAWRVVSNCPAREQRRQGGACIKAPPN